MWAPSLTVGGFTDWRLPTTTQPDATCSIPGLGGPGQGGGFNCTGSEMGHLFNVEGITSAAPGVFDNVQAIFFWSGTEFAPGSDNAWSFIFNDGFQGMNQKGDEDGPFFGWAVRPGNVSAAAPGPRTQHDVAPG